MQIHPHFAHIGHEIVTTHHNNLSAGLDTGSMQYAIYDHNIPGTGT